jgi:hypothetical protein
MAKFDFNDVLKKAGDAAKKATEKAAVAVQIGAERAGAAAQAGADMAQAGAKNLEEAAKKGADKISASVINAAEQRKAEEKKKENEKNAAAEKAAIEATGVAAIAPWSAMKIFYYLMAIDRKISPEEEEQFDLIGKDMDPDFKAHKEALVNECKEQMEKVIDDEDYYDAIQDGVENALTGEQMSNDGFLTPRVLIMDMLTIAYGDNEYGEEERKLLKYVVRKLNIAKDVFLEMESSLLAVNDIDKEINWIKGTDRPYLVIEKQINELEKRKNDILTAVKALIML